jgi:cell division protein FtsA
MCGSRLEAHVHIVTGKTPLIQNLLKCVEQSGIHPDDVVLQPIASSRSVLNSEEKELGVVLLILVEELLILLYGKTGVLFTLKLFQLVEITLPTIWQLP